MCCIFTLSVYRPEALGVGSLLQSEAIGQEMQTSVLESLFFVLTKTVLTSPLYSTRGP